MLSLCRCAFVIFVTVFPFTPWRTVCWQSVDTCIFCPILCTYYTIMPYMGMLFFVCVCVYVRSLTTLLRFYIKSSQTTKCVHTLFSSFLYLSSYTHTYNSKQHAIRFVLSLGNFLLITFIYLLLLFFFALVAGETEHISLDIWYCCCCCCSKPF